MSGKRERSTLNDAIFVMVTVVFFISLWCVLDMEPETWLPIVGLYVSSAYLLPQYWNIMMKGEE